MAESGKIITRSSDDIFNIAVGPLTNDLISRQEKLSIVEKETVVNEAKSILSKCIKPTKTSGSITGIAIGYVQSGKTLSFTTLTTLAIDNGFRIIIFLAGISNNLLDQTTKRIQSDLLTEDENSNKYKVFENASTKKGRSLTHKKCTNI